MGVYSSTWEYTKRGSLFFRHIPNVNRSCGLEDFMNVHEVTCSLYAQSLPGMLYVQQRLIAWEIEPITHTPRCKDGQTYLLAVQHITNQVAAWLTVAIPIFSEAALDAGSFQGGPKTRRE